jgi:uncharacterized membrane protein YedE/YeeE
MSRPAQPYADPYFAGVGLGLVLLGAFVLVGRGLGASGAFASTASEVATVVAPTQAAKSPYFARYLADGVPPWRDWLVVELLGVAIGGGVSAWLAGRMRRTVERGPRLSGRTRLAFAFAGGSAMGLGAVLARGCTSGQALTGGALLSLGSWVFIFAAFAAAYAVAPLLRRLWT